MFDIQLSISAFIFGMSVGWFIIMIVHFIVNFTNGNFRIDDNMGYIITDIIALIVLTISLCFVIKYYKLSNSADVVHERLLNDLDKAEKELQKFYINYPQFEEIKE